MPDPEQIIPYREQIIPYPEQIITDPEQIITDPYQQLWRKPLKLYLYFLTEKQETSAYNLYSNWLHFYFQICRYRNISISSRSRKKVSRSAAAARWPAHPPRHGRHGHLQRGDAGPGWGGCPRVTPALHHHHLPHPPAGPTLTHVRHGHHTRWPHAGPTLQGAQSKISQRQVSWSGFWGQRLARSLANPWAEFFSFLSIMKFCIKWAKHLNDPNLDLRIFTYLM